MILVMNNAEPNEKPVAEAGQATPQKSSRAKAKAAPKKKARKKPAKRASRGESKGAKILNLIARPKGATLAELMKATGWQAHSVRGFLSTAAKKHRIKIESSRNESGDRLYCTAK